MKEANFSELKGKTLIDIQVNYERDIITFTCDDNTKYRMFHEQDCCESVYIEDICGNIESLTGTPILIAEERNTDGLPPKDAYDVSYNWTFYTLATVNGYVDIRWYGCSNGWYSESVNFEQILD